MSHCLVLLQIRLSKKFPLHLSARIPEWESVLRPQANVKNSELTLESRQEQVKGCPALLASLLLSFLINVWDR